ncbi:hypothetical protein XA68_11714 [Ophiocordyceps unilateralis]|uniref:FHA domain-containing protein n=1 Tax=Ophiocordyceps unilateralis TaxID=268505 RepID=A0A2A9PEH8_OPHUN|nr:hypothetical protein XA68_11714 [Ophiocordyceps unilateralis]
MDSPPRLPPSRRVSAHGQPSPSAATTAGTKRLLPAFEPLSSSPGLPRPLKRQNTGAASFMPTPMPTSGPVNPMSSSPPPSHPRLQSQQLAAPTLSTAVLSSPPVPAATITERAPLTALSAVELPENGEIVSLGRSSNSSHVQLSSNRLISRVHVVARYLAGGKLEIQCHGWNGIKVHCQGRTWDLQKGDTFSSQSEGVDVIVDVLDVRVMIQWPRQHGLDDSSAWGDSPSSSARTIVQQQQQQQPWSASPLRRNTRITSPESPTPARRVSMSSQRLHESIMQLPHGSLDDSLRDVDGIQIYEDDADLPVGASMRTEATAKEPGSDAEAQGDEDEDPDEENDPIVHSFGPFGDNIAGRMAMIMSKSPKVKPAAARRPLCPASASTSSMTHGTDESSSESSEKVPPPALDPAVTNHIVNQLAYSRVSSTPLSTIMHNLPAECKAIGEEAVRAVLESTASIGIIRRQGKDAAGKPLESQYYYISEHDDDRQRAAAVVEQLRKPSLRACRKQHKQYYWKRPRTP